MLRILALNESLEQKREQLSVILKKPVYIVAHDSAGTLSSDERYKFPGEDTYRKAGILERNLSSLTGWGHCVKKEDGIRYFDLRPSALLYLAYPVVGITRSQDDPFTHIGLTRGYSYHTITLSPQTVVPEELKPFVHEYQKHGSKTTHQVIRLQFCYEVLAKPLERREHWHTGSKTEKFTTIQPPGQYSGAPLDILGEHNNLGFTNKDPGDCLVCRGASGARQHFGVIVSSGGAYLTNLVCKDCFGQAAKDIQALLEKA